MVAQHNTLVILPRTSGNEFTTVDVDPVFLGAGITAHQMSGEAFVKNKLPTLGKSVNLVYLDSVDWTKQPMLIRRGTGLAGEYNLISEYETRHNFDLNNVSCSVSHLKQVLGLLPFMDDKCVIMLEQTWFNATQDVFVGKGGSAVYLLLAEGFTVLSASWKEGYVLLGRNVSAPGLPTLNLDRLNKIQSNLAVRNDIALYDNVV